MWMGGRRWVMDMIRAVGGGWWRGAACGACGDGGGSGGRGEMGLRLREVDGGLGEDPGICQGRCGRAGRPRHGAIAEGGWRGSEQ